jgi:hypothetical protein
MNKEINDWTEFVRVPRGVFKKYQHVSWTEMIAAAERCQDGLRQEAPPLVPFPEEPPTAEHRAMVAFECFCADYDKGLDGAYYHAGSGLNDKNVACLYVQGWGRATKKLKTPARGHEGSRARPPRPNC